jgi:hypothetical protein
MQQPLVTHKITPEAKRLLRMIAAHTGETQYATLERLLATEWQRVQHATHDKKGA